MDGLSYPSYCPRARPFNHTPHDTSLGHPRVQSEGTEGRVLGGYLQNHSTVLCSLPHNPEIASLSRVLSPVRYSALTELQQYFTLLCCTIVLSPIRDNLGDSILFVTAHTMLSLYILYCTLYSTIPVIPHTVHRTKNHSANGAFQSLRSQKEHKNTQR